mgnify:CR=1 FL=1
MHYNKIYSFYPIIYNVFHEKNKNLYINFLNLSFSREKQYNDYIKYLLLEKYSIMDLFIIFYKN